MRNLFLGFLAGVSFPSLIMAATIGSLSTGTPRKIECTDTYHGDFVIVENVQGKFDYSLSLVYGIVSHSLLGHDLTNDKGNPAPVQGYKFQGTFDACNVSASDPLLFSCQWNNPSKDHNYQMTGISDGKTYPLNSFASIEIHTQLVSTTVKSVSGPDVTSTDRRVTIVAFDDWSDGLFHDAIWNLDLSSCK